MLSYINNSVNTTGMYICNNRRYPRCCSYLILLSLIATLSKSISAFQLHTTVVSNTYHTTHITSSLLSSTNSDDSIEDSSSSSNLESKADDGFGKSVPYVPLSQRNTNGQNNDGTTDNILSSVSISDGGSTSVVLSNEEELLKQSKIRNIIVAISSFAFAIFNYGYHFTHPVTAIEILTTMQKQSAPLTDIGNNGKPTVIDFWAPWCGNCKVAAPTLQAVEEEYGDRVNFIMVNADDARNGPLIQLFGVDAIPHLALLDGDGDAETALIGPTSRNVLRSDLDALLNNDCGTADATKKEEDIQAATPTITICQNGHDELPYKMYDAFGRRDSRRINFVEAMKD